MTPTEIAPLIPSSRNSDSVCVRTVEKVLARYEIFKDVKDIDKSVYRQVCLLFAPKRREQSEERTIRANRYCFAFQLPSDPRIYTGLHATFLRRGNAKVVPRKLSCKRGPADRAQYNRGGNALMVLKVRDDAL